MVSHGVCCLMAAHSSHYTAVDDEENIVDTQPVVRAGPVGTNRSISGDSFSITSFHFVPRQGEGVHRCSVCCGTALMSMAWSEETG